MRNHRADPPRADGRWCLSVCIYVSVSVSALVVFFLMFSSPWPEAARDRWAGRTPEVGPSFEEGRRENGAEMGEMSEAP